jgi:hypothetical protein
MSERTPVLVGGAALILAGLGGTLWVLSGGAPVGTTVDAAAAPASATIPAPSAPPLAAPTDIAREPIPLDYAEAIPMTVYLSPTCGCCSGWVEHMQAAGFDVTLEYHADLVPVKEGFAIPFALQSCHTGVVNGYAIEGHVPPEVVRQFLAEAPAVRGLAVPGMPVGSPGMEVPGAGIDPYDVLTFTSNGETAVYSRQGQPAN